jgi:hypothetical protein
MPRLNKQHGDDYIDAFLTYNLRYLFPQIRIARGGGIPEGGYIYELDGTSLQPLRNDKIGDLTFTEILDVVKNVSFDIVQILPDGVRETIGTFRLTNFYPNRQRKTAPDGGTLNANTANRH